jgi:hypothetical protein
MIGLAILLIPALFLLMFLIGETFGGDISGLGHLAQIIPLVILAYIASKYPFVGGLLLIFVGLVLLVLYTILARIAFPIVDILLFLPLIVSGVLIFISSRPKLP